MISKLGRLINDGGPVHPQALLERARLTGRSEGPLARCLEEFLVERRLAFGLDQRERLAAGRRQRRVDATPELLRPVVAMFCEHLVRSRERARRAGTLERSDSTIEQAIANTRDLARFLVTEQHKTDWATVQCADIEAFLNAAPANRRRRLVNSGNFFRWARKQKLVLVDPTRTIKVSPRSGFVGKTLTITEQRKLFKRWVSSSEPHPHEAMIGLLALLHAFSNTELRQLTVTDIRVGPNTITVEGRPHPVPLDPATLAAVQRCVDHRARLGTTNPHLIVTKITKTRNTAASGAYVTHVLDPAGVTIKQLRSTRLVDLVTSLDPIVISEALGMTAGGVLAYTADNVDQTRLDDTNT